MKHKIQKRPGFNVFTFRSHVRRLRFIVGAISYGPKTAAALAAEYECSAKEIYRDMDMLREMGAEIQATHLGYKLIAAPKFCPVCLGRRTP